MYKQKKKVIITPSPLPPEIIFWLRVFVLFHELGSWNRLESLIVEERSLFYYILWKRKASKFKFSETNSIDFLDNEIPQGEEIN